MAEYEAQARLIINELTEILYRGINEAGKEGIDKSELYRLMTEEKGDVERRKVPSIMSKAARAGKVVRVGNRWFTKENVPEVAPTPEEEEKEVLTQPEPEKDVYLNVTSIRLKLPHRVIAIDEIEEGATVVVFYKH